VVEGSAISVVSVVVATRVDVTYSVLIVVGSSCLRNRPRLFIAGVEAGMQVRVVVEVLVFVTDTISVSVE